jgi:Bardet-Biedl syndrome 2 protein
MNLTVAMADSAQMVKALIIKSEDARLQHNMDYFLKTFSQLQQFNGELLGEYHKRTLNHSELMKNLKTVNQYIHSASNLRFGTSKSRTVGACKEAFKKKNCDEFLDKVRIGG